MHQKQKAPQSRIGKLKTLALVFLLGPATSFSAPADYQLVDPGIDVSPPTSTTRVALLVHARRTAAPLLFAGYPADSGRTSRTPRLPTWST